MGIWGFWRRRTDHGAGCFSATDAGADFTYQTITERGAVLLRGLLHNTVVDRVRSASEALYAERDAEAAKGTLAPEVYNRHVKKRTILLEEILVDGRVGSDVLSHPLLVEMGKIHLGRTPEVSPQSYVRTILPGANDWRLPFHQDETLIKTPILNLWIPLTPCGDDAPGLEVVVTQNRDLLPVAGPADGAYVAERNQIDERKIERRYGRSAYWHPTFSPGDVMVFFGTTIHRSYVRPGMTAPRISVEMRFV